MTARPTKRMCEFNLFRMRVETVGRQRNWWTWLLAAFALLAVVVIARDGWHAYRCPVCRAARRAVLDGHPDWRIRYCRHRAAETDRYVLAVHYQRPEMAFRPIRYVLVAVDRASGVAEELPESAQSVYGIKN